MSFDGQSFTFLWHVGTRQRRERHDRVYGGTVEAVVVTTRLTDRAC